MNQNAGIYSPVNGTTLSSTSATFRWLPVTGSQYWLDVGPTQGSNQYMQSGNIGTVLSQAVNNLPNDGSPVWARIYYLINGSWSYVDNNYTAYNPGLDEGCHHFAGSGIKPDRDLGGLHLDPGHGRKQLLD